MGEPIVRAPSISGTLEASISFIYQTVTQPPSASATVFTDMDITTADLPGDINDDGVVDRADADVIMSFNRQSADVRPPCDIDGDGFITLSDARKLEPLCDCDNCFCE